MEQDLGALHMAQKFVSKPHTLRSSFNQPGNVSHDKSPALSQVHNALHGTQCGKMIVSNLGAGIGYPGQKRGFSHIREPDQTHVSDHFELQVHPQLLGVLPGLGVFGNLHGRGGKVHIS